MSNYSEVNESNLQLHCGELAMRSAVFAQILQQYGLPPLWKRNEGFSTLVQIILEQQVSLASARAAFDKFATLYGEPTPEIILTLSDQQLKNAYFSRQKMSYARELAAALMSGSLDLASLGRLTDDEVREKLTKIKGIGRWTADIYLLMALSRADIMPVGDIAIYAAYERAEGLSYIVDRTEFARIAAGWSPFRSTAARLLWHFYLSTRAANRDRAR